MKSTKTRATIYCAMAVLLLGASVAGVLAIVDRPNSAQSGNQHNNINGQIVHQNSKPARLGATVHVCGNACFEVTPSVLNGTFSISDIPAGHYAVYGEQKSCKSLEYTLSIDRSEIIEIPFALILDQCS